MVSGLSGSGKSIALQALEDLDYYCIDNLPAGLLPGFVHELLDRTESSVRAAVGIDSRNRLFLEDATKSLEALKQLDIDYRIIFLEADEEVLLKRYSETRRRHPLTDGSTSLIEGVRQELNLLAPLSTAADHHIDTTALTPHELRDIIRDYAGAGEGIGLSLLFESFGYKYGTPKNADFVFDVRCLPNPYWKEELRPLTGLDRPTQLFLQSHNDVVRMEDQIYHFINSWLPGFEGDNRSYITVAIGCTGGHHRSVFLVDRLARRFKASRERVLTRHRDILETE
ncbi:MAG: RNase adapter RapZ [Arenicellales bacterium]|nr:RNase adapter RapZ [Arenicellales bacterium]MDP6288727.1 RNase adapter RapZ [Arenicellales bacterium]MDP7482520.1 RNase adapter RapZ [Arenicellales bacterium]MDP7521471.1 RNase adapter RapZ [Arenicellales bacterium]HJL66613.1 RNase adapter RapZ [Arenicellales bacterium]